MEINGKNGGDTCFSNGKIRYSLLPVWMLHTRWNGNDYLFAMNGQTGKLIGDLPIDKGKVTKRFLTLFFPIAAAISALGILVMMM